MPDIKIKSLDGKEFNAYAAMGKNGHGPGIIVIQEIFGVNAAMRSICDGLAAQGYLVVCPDLYWRQKPNISLIDQSVIEWEQASVLYKNFDVEAGIRDLLATLAHVRRMPGCGGKVGTVGYCLGGKLAWLMASRSDVDCAVSYYGVGLDAMLDEVYDIRMPILLHIAGQDKFVPPSAQQKILSSMTRNPVISAYSYAGVDHAFARPQGQNFNSEAANLANSRTLEFLAKNLLG